MKLLADINTNIVYLLIGGCAGGVFCFLILKKYFKNIKKEAQYILESAKTEALQIEKETRLRSTEEANKQREETESLLARKNKELEELRKRVEEREQLVNKQLEIIYTRERELRLLNDKVAKERQELEENRKKIAEFEKEWRSKLESLANLPISNIRSQLMKEVEREVARRLALL
jgi:ribonuclease Y